MNIKMIKKEGNRVFFTLFFDDRITTFIRHFRLFSKRCPNCNGFKENGKKHRFNDCMEIFKKKAIREINKNKFSGIRFMEINEFTKQRR